MLHLIRNYHYLRKEETMKDSFVFYRSFKESLSELTDSDKLLMYEAISDYALDKTEPQLVGFPKALFSLIKPQLDANWKRFENGKKGAEYGCKGGAPKGNNNALKAKTTPKQPQDKGKTTPNVNDNVNVFNVNDNANGNVVREKPKRFVPPSLQEIEDYCIERKNNVDAQKFFDFYTSKNWMVGSNKMKDWKASVRTWENRDKSKYTHPIANYNNNAKDLTNDKRW